MLGDQKGDPGGSQEGPTDDQNETIMAQLKEVLKNSDQSNVTQEKVQEYMNTLSKVKAKRTRLKRDDSSRSSESSGKSIDVNKKERINLLRQKLEENKAKLAERGKNQKGIEDMVTQLKAQLNDSQQLISASPHNLSLAEPKPVEYNSSTSQDELYNILLTKEKRITDLVNKVHKLEGNILDLQENVKEKDCVIDARTKAITLMTESLSKKGKTTLDALDETKEQMRTMQENFVKLEGEMKARQLKLLDDLKMKNLEIADLQETNSIVEQERCKLLEEIEHYKSGSTENELKILLDQKINENSKYLEELSAKQLNNEELRKQLDESNKNMIKAKAQHKNKVKELNKKLDVFKKMNDSNALILQLQNENLKLNEKIAILEEEKGNIQLNIVESETDSQKDSMRIEETEGIIQRHLLDLEEKDKVISILENELRKAKEDVNSLTEKIETFTKIQNDQVSSEINSIQFEEQIDRIESEKEVIRKQKEMVEKENEELLEKIEDLKKQKQELNTKLDNYIQENIELIDKLEKLSAEKVSSAESIEIVEGLTQQEKLELAAYQKNVENIGDNLKCSEEPNVELNDSVLQLGEDSNELLQRIDLFNIERREVMDKLEELKYENNHLGLKLKEIENNRDVLAEAYEQLQNEKEKLNEEIADLRSESAQNELKKSNDDIQEKQITELENKIKMCAEEIENYQLVIEDNKTELINSSTIINDLQQKLSDKEKLLSDLTSEIADLNSIITKLENENMKLSNYEVFETQLSDLKSALEEQLQQTQEYEQELEQNTNTIQNLNQELIEMNKKLLETEHELESKDDEYKKLSKDFENKVSIIENLHATIKEKDDQFMMLKDDLEKRCNTLMSKYSENSNKKVEELTNKNKEQLEKMRKIAANLKKKTQSFQELEEKYNVEKEKWESEIQEKDLIIEKSQEKIASLIEQLKELENEIYIKEQLQNQISILEDRIKELENNNVLLQNTILEISSKKEVNLKEELSGSIPEDHIPSELDSAQSKIKELEMIVETQESDLQHYKDRANKLEEAIDDLENQRVVLEKQNDELNETLSSYVEKLQYQNEVEQKCVFISNEHDNLVKKFQNLIEENLELIRNNRELTDLNEKLKVKINNAQEKVNELMVLQTNVEELESVNESLKLQLANFELSQKNIQNENEHLLKQNKNEVEKIEADFQQQLQELLSAKNELIVRCEKLQEQVDEGQRNAIELNELRSFDINNKEQIQYLSGELNNLGNVLQQKDDEINDLVKQLENAKQELLVKTASSTVDNIIVEAERKLSQDDDMEKNIKEIQSIPTFQWPDNSNQDSAQWFEQQTVQQQSENSQEDLLKKIKTLEFMLYNMEKEKNDAVLQCHEMSNELTRLVYERENWSLNTKPVVEDLESQIVTSEVDSVVPQKDLQEIEFTKTDRSGVEGVIEPKQAYLCYQPTTGIQSIEDQVLTETDLIGNPQELRELEFTKTNTGPETVVEAKDAYLCYKNDGENVGVTVPLAFGENDDGWGWGPEEGRLEEEHIQQSESTPQFMALKTQLDELNETVKVMQLERENHLEEIKQLQIKSGKLIKKCKELKQKNDRLTSKSNTDGGSDLFNLDEAIQEELKSQISQLEKKIKEINNELDKERNEHEVLLKKIDSLSASNDRMTVAKEKQEIETLNLQRKYQETVEKLRQYEWGDDGFNNQKSQQPETIIRGDDDDNKKKIDELNKTIKELSLDNEELQVLLEEQRTRRNELEKSKNIQVNEAELKEKEILIQDYQEKLRVITEMEDEKKLLEEKLKNVTLAYDDMERNFSEIQKVLYEKDSIIDNLQGKIVSFENAGDSNNQQVNDLQNQVRNLLQEKEIVVNELKESLKKTVEKYENEIKDQKQSYDFTVMGLNQKNTEIQVEIEELEQKLQNKDEEISNLISSLEKAKVEIDDLTETLQKKDEEIVNLNTNWESQVDQRGFDVAQSWKLHLDTVEAEFSANQAQLLKDMNELEEKCNGLVNENNELRKNVDAEIRNEVDRISGLQQYVNELNNSLQEKQNEIAEMQKQLEEIQNQLKEKDDKLASVDLIIETTQKQFDEKREVVEEIVKILERNSFEPLSFEKQQVIGEFERQLEQKEKEISEFKIQFDAREKKFENELLNYKQQFEEIKSKLEVDLEEKRNEIISLSTELKSTVNNQDVSKIEEELELSKREYIQLQQSFTDNQQQLLTVNQYYHEKCNELENVMYQLQIAQQNLQTYESELANLKTVLKEKEESYTELKQNLEYYQKEYENVKTLLTTKDVDLETKLHDIENHYENVLSVKENEIVNLQLQVTQLNERLQEISIQLINVTKLLDDKTVECEKLRETEKEQSVLLEEENKQLIELRGIIEEQVMKIEELKKDLFAKSNDYDSLIAEVDIGKNTITKQPVATTENKVQKDDDLTEAVSRAELDLALYMLHQRDVRCEELTVELTQLLEERDTLQLRLSNAIREKEEFKKYKEDDVGNISLSQVPESVETPSTSDKQNLATKLFELKSVGYKKDKTFVDEQELRRIQQLSIMQEHMNEASKLPPEAAAKLVDASYTLSRDVQSTPKVLLNWLWGRSTPKQNDI